MDSVEPSHDASDANPDVARLQEDYYVGPRAPWHAIDASGMPGQTLARAKAALSE
jgi:hypothetical protein